MNKRMLLVLVSIMSLLSVHGRDAHASARELFFVAGQETCRAEELLRVTEQEGHQNHAMYAYHGAAYTMLADCVQGPMKKWKYFNRGKQIIEEAILLDPEDPEIRFIRFMVQDRAPAFLSYDNRDEDLPELIQAIQGRTVQGPGHAFLVKMARAIASSDYPDNEQRKIIEGLVNQ